MTSKKSRQIRGVLFDMDGTLLDTEQLYLDAWKRVSKERGYELTDAFLETLRGASLNVIAERFEAHFDGKRSYRVERAARQKYVMAEIEQNGVPVKKGARELLDWMKENGLPAAVATSTPQETANMFLSESGLLPAFDAVVTGDMVTNGKPAPDIFLLAAERIGIDIEACVVVEDSLNGVTAGRRSGAAVCYVPDLSVLSKEEIAENVDVVLPSLSDMIPWIAAKNG